jgi:uncharacterized protein
MDHPPRRFRRCRAREVLGRRVPVARRPLPRLLGLALLRRARAGQGLLLPRCRSVHTFGMRFPLDLLFLDRAGVPVRIERRVGRRRLLRCPAAVAVLELPAPAPAPAGETPISEGG